MARIRGGQAARRRLEGLNQLLSRNVVLRVGFLEGATYPNGTPVAMIAAIQNFGAPRAGIPPRPFFSNMIRAKSPEWGGAIAGLLRENDFNPTTALNIAGETIAGQLREEIINTNAPPLAASTIRRKGFSKPLIHTSLMYDKVDHEIVDR